MLCDFAIGYDACMHQFNPTVPAPNEPLVITFLEKYSLHGTPVYVDYSDHGYAPNQCHLSAKHHAMVSGGRRVHGWALWQFGSQIDAEYHSVWETPDGNLVDVTPPKFGGDRVLFIRDDASDIVECNGVFSMWADRTTVPGISFVYQGKPINEPNWGLPKSLKIVTDYCSMLGMSPDAMVTDPHFG